MKLRRCAGLAGGIAAGILFAVACTAAQQISGVDVRSTSVVRRTPAGDRQIVRAVFTAAKDIPGASLRLFTPGSVQPLTTLLDTVRAGKNVRFVEIVPVAAPATVRYEIAAGSSLLDSGRTTFTPARKRTVYDVEVSHHDMGYADYYHLMRRDVREMGIEMALDFCRRTDDREPDARFHWTVETSEPMTKFISSQPPAVVAELVRRIKEGRIELGGLHNSVSTEMLSPELMARLFYTPNRTVVDLLGVRPSRTALIDDVVGFSRALPLFLKEADVPYFYHGYNETVDALSPASKDPVFFWRAVDGDTVHMPLFRSFPYYSPDRLLKYDVGEIAGLLLKYDADPRWVYDCLIVEDSYDFSVPQFENVEGIRAWNAQYANPVLRSGTFSMFFDDIMHQTDRTKIPVYTQDGPNAWADEDGSDARSMADARLLNYRLPEIERMSTFAFASGGKGYPWTELWESYHKLLSYHEHTNGAFSEEDVLPIPLLKDRKAANANYYECEQVMHKDLVRDAQALADAAHAQSVSALSRLITTSADRTIVVFNSLNWERGGLVRVAAPGAGAWSVVDPGSGRTMPTQQLSDGSVAFLADAIPSMGYRTFRWTKQAPKNAVTLRAAGTEIENEYYRVTIDTVTGGVAGIWDKRRGIELVDRSAPYKLHEYIYQRIEGPGARKPVEYHPTMIGRSSFAGQCVAGITTRMSATGCVSIEQTVALTAGSDVIDFRVHLDRSESGRMLKQNSNENKKRSSTPCR